MTMSFAMLIAGGPGHEILHPDPGYPIYKSMIDFSGATAVGYPLRGREGFSLRADEVLARITPRTRLLILNSPANPTGASSRRSSSIAWWQGSCATPRCSSSLTRSTGGSCSAGGATGACSPLSPCAIA